MAKRKHNHRLIRALQTYSVSEVADLLNVHKNTVRTWQRDGLKPIDNRKPTLFLGRTLIEFLREKREAGRVRLKPGEIYCVACHGAKEPALGMVHIVPLTATGGNLKGVCPDCERYIYRRVSLTRFAEVTGNLAVTNAQAISSLIVSPRPSVNCDSERGGFK